MKHCCGWYLQAGCPSCCWTNSVEHWMTFVVVRWVRLTVPSIHVARSLTDKQSMCCQHVSRPGNSAAGRGRYRAVDESRCYHQHSQTGLSSSAPAPQHRQPCRLTTTTASLTRAEIQQSGHSPFHVLITSWQITDKSRLQPHQTPSHHQLFPQWNCQPMTLVLACRIWTHCLEQLTSLLWKSYAFHKHI